jgi:HPt (histidine-containing phosphotransfer) domain-containing protein
VIEIYNPEDRGDTMGMEMESIKRDQVFDLEEALENAGGDMDLLKEIAEIFLEDYQGQFKQIKEGILSGKAEDVEHAAHSLKGSVAAFGAKRSYELAYQLEVMGREKKLAGANEVLEEFGKELDKLQMALRLVLSEGN